MFADVFRTLIVGIVLYILLIFFNPNISWCIYRGMSKALNYLVCSKVIVVKINFQDK